MVDEPKQNDTPTRSGKSVDSSNAVNTTATKKKKQSTTPLGIKSKTKKAKGKKQAELPHNPNTYYAREHQLRYDDRIKLDAVVDEATSKIAIVN